MSTILDSAWFYHVLTSLHTASHHHDHHPYTAPTTPPAHHHTCDLHGPHRMGEICGQHNEVLLLLLLLVVIVMVVVGLCNHPPLCNDNDDGR